MIPLIFKQYLLILIISHFTLNPVVPVRILWIDDSGFQASDWVGVLVLTRTEMLLRPAPPKAPAEIH